MTNDGGNCKLRGTDRSTLKLIRQKPMTTELDGWREVGRDCFVADAGSALGAGFLLKKCLCLLKEEVKRSCKRAKRQGKNPRAIASTV